MRERAGVLLFPSLRGYRKAWLRKDLVAALTVWAVLVPESLAYATIAGVSPVVGLYAAVPALALYAAFGSSRHLVVASMSGTAALSASVVAGAAPADADAYAALTVGLALVVGLLGIVAGLCRLGFLSAFISEPVLKGFIIGLALTIIVGQVPALIGVDKPSGSFVEKTWGLLGELGDVHGPTLAIGAAALALILGLRRFVPRVPGSLVAVLLGILAVTAFDLQERGIEIVGHIDAGLPTVGLPDMGWGEYLGLVGPAVGVLLIGFAEGLGAAKTYAAREHYEIDANRELIGMGAANLGSGLVNGMVVNGSLSKTAVNGAAGAKSQVSTIIVSGLTVITLLLLTGLFENLPEAVLAAVVIAAVIDLVDFAALKRLWRVWTQPLGDIYRRAARIDFIAAVGTMVGVLLFDTLPGLFIGIALSVLTLLYRASRPHVPVLAREDRGGDALWLDAERHPSLDTDPTVLVVRVEGGLFFANTDFVRDRIRGLLLPETQLVVIDAETTPFIDVSGASMLVELRDELALRGIRLRLAGQTGQVRDIIRTSRTGQPVFSVHATVDDAVRAE
ncbi:SulP family inorganic anion transporter [Aeromicrobium tamlense]|uniref:High affinity sulfate transporter 1 n=1 Tax=Aeromicrobium tamlense TaxID=375541 RepID=A0A8I0G1C8_9ACTN|nr:SulP family inorganic anion transporter [Aeromicrobium tamlense]MBD1270739.1 SulP family inorganic anion transporter [Aeromicrobium tamlense]MBD1271129.1 SulP family inorganic anion transporter [Aeromicrobium tamlense]NYI38131.1 high affinity sulfate transporter 1 [Aeromicrobium tamlense]